MARRFHGITLKSPGFMLHPGHIEVLSKQQKYINFHIQQGTNRTVHSMLRVLLLLLSHADFPSHDQDPNVGVSPGGFCEGFRWVPGRHERYGI